MKLLASLILTASLAVSAFSVHANTAAPAEAASAPAAVKAEPKKPAKPDLAQGEAKFTAVCAACHGASGLGDGAKGKGLDPAPANFHDTARMAKRSVFGLYNLGAKLCGFRSHRA